MSEPRSLSMRPASSSMGLQKSRTHRVRPLDPDPPAMHEPRLMRSLHRTRTDDPFLTMEVVIRHPAVAVAAIARVDAGPRHGGRFADPSLRSTRSLEGPIGPRMDPPEWRVPRSRSLRILEAAFVLGVPEAARAPELDRWEVRPLLATRHVRSDSPPCPARRCRCSSAGCRSRPRPCRWTAHDFIRRAGPAPLGATACAVLAVLAVRVDRADGCAQSARRMRLEPSRGGDSARTDEATWRGYGGVDICLMALFQGASGPAVARRPWRARGLQM
jgi:hypothetical protein